jgi:NAD(P)-dependent dehydrogenase (short-subunit alcohol dehydrogenase family)
MKPAELFSLKGQTAVIIGGTGELCGAIAEGFAAAGAHVVLVGRDTTKAEARLSKNQSKWRLRRIRSL